MRAKVLPHLGERHRRLVCGAAAIALGRGGVTHIAELARVPVPTVTCGARELDDTPNPTGRPARPGGGPKRAVEANRAWRRRWTGWSTLHPRRPPIAAPVDDQVHPPPRRRPWRARLPGLRRHGRPAAQAAGLPAAAH